jgi:DNA-binding transcriptional ArsR family regulator
MNGVELFLLGRKLMKLGQESMPRAGFQKLPASVQSILIDALEHPNSTVGEIARRTGFPQSHVSVSIARLQKGGALVTGVDPDDRRKTLVRPASGVIERVAERVSVPIDTALSRALGTLDPRVLADTNDKLESLAVSLLAEAQAGSEG